MAFSQLFWNISKDLGEGKDEYSNHIQPYNQLTRFRYFSDRYDESDRQRIEASFIPLHQFVDPLTQTLTSTGLREATDPKPPSTRERT